MALVKPVAVVIDVGVTNYGGLYDAATASLAALAQAPGLADTQVVVVDALGRLTPGLSRSIAADTFGGASSDDLVGFSFSAWPDGLECEIEAASLSDVVTLRHLHDVTGLADTGAISLSDGQNPDDGVALDTLFKRLRIRRKGGLFVETGRYGFPDVASTIGTAPQSFGGYAVGGMKAKVLRVTHPFTLVRATHVGNMMQFLNAGTWILPNPATANIQEGDFFLWDCPTSTLIFRQWDGNPPTSALNHDRALGAGAQGWVQAVTNLAGTGLVWRLLGVTDAPPVVGGGSIARVFSFTQAANDYPVPDDTTPHTAHSHTHAYGASEKWLYLASFGVLGLGSTGANAAVASFVKNTGSDVTVGQARRPRWPTGVGRYGFLWGQSYGGTPGSATFRVDVQNSATGNPTTVQKPAVLALRLETGEDFAQDLGPNSDSAGAYVDVISWTKTTVADDFVLFAGFQLSASASQLADVQLLVDGIAAFPAETVAVDGVGPHSWMAPWPVTLSAGSHTFKIQIRRNALSASGTVTGANATLALVAAGAFQRANTDKSGAVSSYSSATYATKISDSWTLEPGYQTLVVAGARGYSANAGTGTSAKLRARRNAALLQPEAVAGVRTDAAYEPSSWFYLGVVRPSLTTDAFDVGGANVDGATEARVEGASLIALALKT